MEQGLIFVLSSLVKKGIYMKKSSFQRRAAATRSRQVALRRATRCRNLNHSSDPERIGSHFSLDFLISLFSTNTANILKRIHEFF